MSLTVGLATPNRFWSSAFEQKQATLKQLTDVGIDQVYMADHVSFRDGSGTDGFVEIAALSQLHPSIDVMISVYLLALRHPMPVARQMATMSTIAPGRFRFGVGIGGDDRHEIEVCGVDPRTRGRRTNEALDILRQLSSGAEIDFDGEFFSLEAASIRPAPDPPVPIIIGGRSDAALARTAKYGDGWIGAWCSPRRFVEALAIIDELAVEHGRDVSQWQHGYQPWCAVADNPEAARALVAREMESFYKVPFEAFEKYVPYGTADMVADALAPYVEAGCSILNLKVVAEDDRAAIEAAGHIAANLRT